MRILVTGAAGLIGGALCGELAARGHAVLALVHRSRDILHLSGAPVEVAPGPDALSPGRVALVAGDIRQSGLGLAEADALAATLDVIVHCAAETSFAASPERHRAVNVTGTANVVAFAGRAPIPARLVHVSTAYVCGETTGTVAEKLLDGAPSFANPYEASKAEAEAIVVASDPRAAIARPSIVVGAAATGAIGRFDNIYALLRLIGAGRVKVLPATPEATLDLVPLDHVVYGLADIAERPQASGVFHLVSGAPLPVADIVMPVYPGFHVPRLLAPEAFDAAALPPSEGALYRNAVSIYQSYLRRDLRFETGALHVLSGRTCPPTGPDFLRRLVAFAVEAGYLRPDPRLSRAAALT